MEHLKKIFTLFLMIAMTMMVVACGDDSDEPDNTDQNALIGTWEGVWSEALIETMGDFYESGEQLIQFRGDGTAIEVDILVFTDFWAEYEGKKEEISKLYTSWEIKGDKILIIDENDRSYHYKYKIKRDQLTLTLLSGSAELPLTFNRVSDSRINKYLD